MATRTRTTQKKLDPNLVNRFMDHRIWHFIKVAKAKGENKVMFHHPVGVQANITYAALFELLADIGLKVKQARPESGWGAGVGLVEISDIDKPKTVLF